MGKETREGEQQQEQQQRKNEEQQQQWDVAKNKLGDRNKTPYRSVRTCLHRN